MKNALNATLLLSLLGACAGDARDPGALESSGVGREDRGAAASDDLQARLAAIPCVASAEREGTVTVGGGESAPTDRFLLTVRDDADGELCAQAVAASDAFLQIDSVLGAIGVITVSRPALDADRVASVLKSLECVRDAEPSGTVTVGGDGDGSASGGTVLVTVDERADAFACADAILARSPSLAIDEVLEAIHLITVSWR